MKQILQDLRTGQISVEEVAVPLLRPGHLLIQTTCSLISSGTERSLLEFGRAGYIGKARQQPQRVRQVLDKIRTDGLVPAVESVRARLDEAVALGYSSVGRVTHVGAGIHGIRPGDRVASNGQHAETVLIAKHLCARLPDNVSDEAAVFAVVGSVAMQGIRLLEPTIGESFAVFGLGLVGLLAVQILKASGARVIGFDPNAKRVALARRFGAEATAHGFGVDPVEAALAFTNQMGVDGVLITATTESDDVVHQAAHMSRKRGRIIVTGVVGLNLQREDFYEKELRLQVSCSYGPGRYDPAYETDGNDYPVGFVRWTEQRNLEAMVELLSDGRVRVDDLIDERVPIDDAHQAYETLAARDAVAVLLTYPDSLRRESTAPPSVVVRHRPTVRREHAVCGVIGSGEFAKRTLLPALRKTDAQLKWVASSGGTSGAVAARRFGAERSTTDYREVLSDREVDFVLIATRHDSHANLVIQALKAGKSVFVEKPLCITDEELMRIQRTYESIDASADRRPIVMVGLNRRFAPLSIVLRTRIAQQRQPMAMVFTCNAGQLPAAHWLQDPTVGGGRLIGEACHFIDLLGFFADAPIRTVYATGFNFGGASEDTATISLTFADGSIGHVHYFSNGARRYPKERLELFVGAHVYRIDNFRRLTTFGRITTMTKRGFSQNKGHDNEVAAFVRAVSSGTQSPIAFSALVNTMEATLAVATSLKESRVVTLASMNTRDLE